MPKTMNSANLAARGTREVTMPEWYRIAMTATNWGICCPFQTRPERNPTVNRVIPSYFHRSEGNLDHLNKCNQDATNYPTIPYLPQGTLNNCNKLQRNRSAASPELFPATSVLSHAGTEPFLSVVLPASQRWSMSITMLRIVLRISASNAG